jgi:hypothetical protein
MVDILDDGTHSSSSSKLHKDGDEINVVVAPYNIQPFRYLKKIYLEILVVNK